jgi:RNA-binding protein
MSATLTQDQKRSLKSKAHALNPVVMIAGKGLTPAVLAEVHQALLVHELIKVKVSGYEKEERTAIANEICEQTQAALVQQIGHVLVLYKKNEQKVEKDLRPKTHSRQR